MTGGHGQFLGQEAPILPGLSYICWEQPQQVARHGAKISSGSSKRKQQTRASSSKSEWLGDIISVSHTDAALAIPTLLPRYTDPTSVYF